MPSKLQKVAFLGIVAAVTVLAETSPKAVEPVSVGNLKRYVSNLDKSVPIYRDVFGLEMPTPATQFAVNPDGQKATNTPGASYRVAFFKLPGVSYRLELVEYKDVERKMQTSRKESDAGDQSLVLDVRDLEAPLARAKAAGLKIDTVGGQPITRTNANGSSSRAIVFRDPDGMQVEIFQPTPIPDAEASVQGNVMRSHTDITVDDIDKVVAFYRDVLGFDMGKMGEPRRDEATMKLIGIESATDHPANVGSGISINGKPLGLSLIEFKGIKHAKANFRPQDPGSEGFSLAVKDLQSAAKAIKASGADIMTVGGAPIMNSKGGGLMYFHDVNGTIIELSQAAQ